MEEIKKLVAVNRWQNFKYVHPLTCYEHITKPLKARINSEGKCELYCEECGYVQKWIPNVVSDFGNDDYYNHMMEQYKALYDAIENSKQRQRDKDSHF